jgi:hypothetical protein
VIRICYKDFSGGTHDVPGLHGKAERGARGVTVYLLPGLTTGQRRAVLRRLRQEASRGFGPPLQRPQLAIALGLDRVRTAARILRAAVRLHPAVTLVPGAFVVAMAALFVIASSDGPGSALKTRAGLAEAAASASASAGGGGGGGNLAAVNARPDPTRMARVSVAVGAHAGTGRTGRGTGQCAKAKHADGKRHHDQVPARAAVRSGTWYVCPQAMTAPALRPSDDQLACCLASSWAEPPHTAHQPGPRDLAR